MRLSTWGVPSSPGAPRRVPRQWLVALALATAGAVGFLPAPARAEAVPGPSAPAAAPPALEALAPYVGQTTCDPVAKAGTRALAEMVLTHYGVGWNGGYVRDCASGGTSEHKEGRAWDWMLKAEVPAERVAAEEFLGWLVAPGPAGEVAYNARRLGVMYVIWDHRIWSAQRAADGWLPYGGADPHTGHVHISLSWSGALRQTSWWTGVAGDVAWRPPAPAPADEPAPAEDPELVEEPAPPTEPAPPASQYTVAPGDTLGHIALAHGIPVDGIMAANELTSTVIRPGQALVIPAPQEAADGREPPRSEYTVAPGDTLGHIALARGVRVEAIMATNHLPATVIRVGQVLVIPDQH